MLVKNMYILNRRSTNIEQPPGKYDLSKWKYSELRDTINTSCDIELLEVNLKSKYLIYYISEL